MRVYEASLSYHLVQLGDDLIIDTTEKVVDYLASAFATHPLQESFWVILLDRKNHPISRVMISLGSLTGTIAHPREVFKPAILASAAAILIAHNHPSGDPSPSTADILTTRQLQQAGKLLGIEVLDHVICGHPESDPNFRGYYSFAESGKL